MTEGKKRVLGIVGSPRRGGNTEILVDEALRGAEEAGALVEKVILRQLTIGPCLGCDVCRKTGKCAQQDDMQPLLEKMGRSQVWVLGTPIYWWGPTAWFKAFLDRWYGANYAEMFSGRRVILTIPLEETQEHYARHTVGMFKNILSFLKMELFATVVALGVLDRGDVREHPDYLEAAYLAGRKAVEIEGVVTKGATMGFVYSGGED